MHGGGLDGRSWEPLLPHLAGHALAVDLPGRGSHPAPLTSVSFEACAEAVVGDIDEAGFEEVVLVGHSLAGASMPSMVERLGSRVRHAVFVACTLPPNGSSILDTLDPAIQDMVRSADPRTEPVPMSGEIAAIVLGNDLSPEQLAWCTERLVAEAPRLTFDPVMHDGLRSTPTTWVRTTQDMIVAPEKQLRFAGQLAKCDVIDLDAGHMCMISQPTALAAILNEIASRK